MAIQKSETITITFTDAVTGLAYLNDNPLINKVRKIAGFEHAELYDPAAYQYLIRVPRIEKCPKRNGKPRKSHRPWDIHILPSQVREWLFNYLEREVVAPLQFNLPLPVDVKEEFRLNMAIKKMLGIPVPQRGAPVHKYLRKKKRKMKKVVDNATDSAIVGPVSKSCDHDVTRSDCNVATTLTETKQNQNI